MFIIFKSCMLSCAWQSSLAHYTTEHTGKLKCFDNDVQCFTSRLNRKKVMSVCRMPMKPLLSRLRRNQIFRFTNRSRCEYKEKQAIFWQMKHYPAIAPKYIWAFRRHKFLVCTKPTCQRRATTAEISLGTECEFKVFIQRDKTLY